MSKWCAQHKMAVEECADIHLIAELKREIARKNITISEMQETIENLERQLCEVANKTKGR